MDGAQRHDRADAKEDELPAPDGIEDLTFKGAGGFGHSCGVTTDARAYCWGGNGYGQLGDGTQIQRLLPVPVAGPM